MSFDDICTLSKHYAQALSFQVLVQLCRSLLRSLQSEQSARVTMLPCKKVLTRPGRNSLSDVYSKSITSFQFTTRSFLAHFSVAGDSL